ncbi:hypothetical protein P4E94_05805 [Pontiellaceae bacterium B12219]|nr:hypothetical protein [Pontiellaceae bacterium B12219]
MKWIGLWAMILAVPAVWAGSAHVDFDKQLIFPQELGGMTFEVSELYNNKALGYALLYTKDPDFACEVSVLNLGRSEIPDGCESDGIEVIFQGVEVQLQREQEEGTIADLKTRGTRVVPPTSPLQFKNRIFQFSEFREVDGKTNSIPRINSVYVTGSHNHFIRVQFRFDIAENRAAQAMADQLVKQLVLLLIAENSEDDLTLAACEALIYGPGDYSGMLAAQHVFAQAQEMGELNVYDSFFVWPQNYKKPENADLLVAAYFAGMLQVVIPEHLDSGGEYEAFDAMLTAYETMRARDQISAIAELDAWAKAPDRKAEYRKQLVEFGYVAPE